MLRRDGLPESGRDIATHQRSCGKAAYEPALLVAALSAGCFWFWALGDAPYDDAYVYFRYADNLLAGNGPVFNVGERVEGYSSPLWLLFVVLGAAMGVGPEAGSQGLGFACFLGTAVLLYRYGRGRFGASPLAACLPLAFLAAPANALNATLGLETSLVALLLVLVVVLSEERAGEARRDVALGMAFGALSLSRPEAVAYYLVFLSFEFLRLRAAPDVWPRLARTASGLLPFGGFLAWRLAYYGYWMPNTFYAKVGFTSASLQNGLFYLVDYTEAHIGGCVFLGIVVVDRFLRRAGRWDTPAALLACGALLTVLSGGNNLPGWRYAAPLGGLVAIVLVDFLAGGTRWAGTLQGTRRLSIGLISVVFFAHSVLSGAAALVGRDELRGVLSNNQKFAASARFHGELFEKILEPRQSIALNAIPIVAYHFPGRIIDMLGLVDETIAHRDAPLGMGRRIHGHEKGDGRYVLAERPTLIILQGGPYLASRAVRGYPRPSELYYVSEQEIAASDAFRGLYEPVAFAVGNRFSNFYRLRNEALLPVGAAELDALHREMLARAVPSARAGARDSLARGWAGVCAEPPVRVYLTLRSWTNFSGTPLVRSNCPGAFR